MRGKQWRCPLKIRSLAVSAALFALFFGGCVTDKAVEQFPEEAGVVDARSDSDASTRPDVHINSPQPHDASRLTADVTFLDPDGSILPDASMDPDTQVQPDAMGEVDVGQPADVPVPELDASQPVDARELPSDMDGDGTPDAIDCGPMDPSRYIGAPERCNGLDDDCDREIDEDAVDSEQFWRDRDGDAEGNPDESVIVCHRPEGYVQNGFDCDDSRSNVFVGAPEFCDGLDNDCNREIDEGAVDASVWYEDFDGDGAGDPLVMFLSCSQIEGTVNSGFDCNDRVASIHPSVMETCNQVDDDCDEEVDEDAVDMLVWYQDADGDDAGNPFATLLSCSRPEGYESLAGDCDDQNNTVQNYGDEVCDQLDNDCNGLIDDGVQFTTYADVDGDGYGEVTTGILGCDIPEGRTEMGGDCNDADSTVNPGQREVCDLFDLDEDCNGSADDSDGSVARNSLHIFFQDADSDGYGDPQRMIELCDAVEGVVSRSMDCDDANAQINPDGEEVCDHVDNDCDDETDEEVMRKWYADRDNDKCPEGTAGGEVADATFACERPDGYIEADSPEITCALSMDDLRLDCDDENASVNPNVDELCNGLDDDCDGEIDQDAVDEAVWYQDADGDLAGNPNVTIDACDQPMGYLLEAGDCDDGDNDVQADGMEICDGEDNDCNGLIDDGVQIATYADLDLDTFGDPTSEQFSCSPVAGRTFDHRDCNDNDATIHPFVMEVCDHVDNNCNGEADEGVLTMSYDDDDGDGFGGLETGFLSCLEDVRRVLNDDDCNDQDENINPNAVEVCDGNDADEDCDNLVDDEDPTVDPATRSRFAPDVDEDGYGDASNVVFSCNQPPSTLDNLMDCDDTAGSIHPNNAELENGVDDDCDGVIDEGTNAFDDDGDGYSENEGDCNDADPTFYPNQRAEVCDGLDNDCDGTVDELVGVNVFTDADGDGHGVMAPSSVWVCAHVPAGMSATSDDCDDLNPAVYPGAAEMCNGIDDNCNRQTDEAAAVDARTWYQDVDTDTFGNALRTRRACSQPIGYVLDGADCNDRNSSINPFAVEVCDLVDNNCNGQTDEDVTLAYFPDRDGDREGDGHSLPTNACLPPLGFVQNNADCDDSSRTINTFATEICDALDNDCDGDVDEDVMVRKCLDADHDGFGAADEVCVDGCPQVGYVDNVRDCDDHNNTINPNGSEVCDGRDNDCDGLTDAADMSVDPKDVQTGYMDFDADRWGDVNEPVIWCSNDAFPENIAWDSGDCNNGDSTIYPHASEVCGSNVDHDCDGTPGNEELCIDAGSYTGPFSIRVSDPVFGRPSGACTGTATFTFSLAQDRHIMGNVTCTYDGDFLNVYPGLQHGTIEGEVYDSQWVSGFVTLEHWDWDFYFSGEYVDSNEMNASFDENQNRLDGHRFDTVGELSATLVP